MHTRIEELRMMKMAMATEELEEVGEVGAWRVVGRQGPNPVLRQRWEEKGGPRLLHQAQKTLPPARMEGVSKLLTTLTVMDKEQTAAWVQRKGRRCSAKLGRST